MRLLGCVCKTWKIYEDCCCSTRLVAPTKTPGKGKTQAVSINKDTEQKSTAAPGGYADTATFAPKYFLPFIRDDVQVIVGIRIKASAPSFWEWVAPTPYDGSSQGQILTRKKLRNLLPSFMCILSTTPPNCPYQAHNF
jgi:hypothetical protein